MPPNILWIVTTQWRAQACGYAGDPNARTPCLDALAAQCVEFHAGRHAPSLRPVREGGDADRGRVARKRDPRLLRPAAAGARTIAHAMRERSYSTAFFGKWHLYRRDSRARLDRRGAREDRRPAGIPGRLRLLGGIRERLPPQQSLAARHAPARARPLRRLPERRRVRARRPSPRGSGRPGSPWSASRRRIPPTARPPAGARRATPLARLRGNVPAGPAGRGEGPPRTRGLLRAHRGDRPRDRVARGEPAAFGPASS
jgi:hypothetical protein